MIIAALLTATLLFSAWLLVRLTQETCRINALIAADDRAQAICDAVDMTTDGEERVVEL